MDPVEFQAQVHEIDKKVTEIAVDLKYVKEKLDKSGCTLEKNTADIADHIRRTDILQHNQDAVIQTLASMSEAMKEVENKMKPMATHLMFHSWVAKGIYLVFGGSILVTLLNLSQIIAALAPLFHK